MFMKSRRAVRKGNARGGVIAAPWRRRRMARREAVRIE
jgi:hypothetical protein